jgi:hypothetical protein
MRLFAVGIWTRMWSYIFEVLIVERALVLEFGPLPLIQIIGVVP